MWSGKGLWEMHIQNHNLARDSECLLVLFQHLEVWFLLGYLALRRWGSWEETLERFLQGKICFLHMPVPV